MSIMIWDEISKTFKDITNIKKINDNNTWTNCDNVLSYKNNIWEEKMESYDQLINYTLLYYSGDECSSLTNGWVQSHMNNHSMYSDSNAVKKYSDRIHLLANSASNTSSTVNKYGCITTNKTINVSNYQYIGGIVDYAINSGASLGYMLVCASNEKYLTSSSMELTFGLTQNQKTVSKTCGIGSIKSLSLTTPYITVSAFYAGEGNLYSLCLIKDDDYNTLAEKAGLNISSIDDIFTNSNVLLSNKDAVKFMVAQCTGYFMFKALGNSTFLQELNGSPYESIIRKNEHWNKFLSLLN